MRAARRAEELLHELLERGARVWAEDGELACQLSPEALTPDLRQALRAAKQELLALLGRHRHHVQVSYAQQRLWFLEQLAPGDPAFHLTGARQLQGPLDAGALERALAEVVRRHESLRTTFGSLDGRPFQVIATPAPPRLPRADLTALPASRRPEEVRRRLRAEARRPFDLVRGPLMRTVLLQLARDEHVLFVNLHHIVSDGWSQGVFHRELAALYAAFTEGRPSPLPELALQYADYAVWQRRWLRGELREAQLAYWRRRLAGLEPAELPTDRPRPAVRSYRAGVFPLAVPGRQALALQRRGAAADATLFMTLLAAFLVLLSRATGRLDVAVGSPIANRHRLEVEGLIGFFLNTLVLRGELAADMTFHQLVDRVREVCLGAYEHQDLPIEMLLEELDTGRDLARSPLFQVLFIAQNPSAKPLEMAGLQVSPFRMGVGGAQFDLVVSLTATADGIHGIMSYDEDLFDRTTIARLARSYTTLLAGAEDPDRAVLDLPSIGAAERHQLLREFCDGEAPAATACLHDLFEAQAERTPEAVAVVLGDERLSYAELARRARRTAHRLRALGVGPEVRVAISIERSPAMVVGVLGILLAGGAYVPLDPEHPEERLLFQLEDSGAAVLLTSSGLRDRFAAADPGIRQVLIDGELPPGPERPVRRAVPRNLAYVTYTSGSTGRPKAVAVEHRSAVDLTLLAVAHYPVEAGDRVLQFASLGFDTSVEEIFPALAAGATLVLWDGGIPAVGELLGRLRDLAVTVLDLPTAYWHELVAQAEADGLALPPLLRLLILGGERVSPARLRGWRRLVLPPSLRLLNTYGPTEATVVSTWCVLRGSDESDPPIGRPFAGVRAYVLDRRLRPVPRGAPGELCLGGTGLARGYFGRPAWTAGSFPPNPLSDVPGSRLYRTGDRVRWRGDGQLAFLGRVDRQVKVRGYRIEPGEVEAALLAHPGVRQAAVVARRPSVDAPVSLVGFYVAEGSATVEGLRRFLAARLPAYMVPAFWVKAEALPVTAGGKVDRRALAPDRDVRPRPEAAAAPPRSPTEEILTEIWEELLEVRGIGVHDDFFHLGGHSLLATQMVSRIRRAFAVELPVRGVFERPTVAGLAAEVDAQRRPAAPGVSSPPRPAARRSGARELPLSFAQQRLWFLQQLLPSSSVYNMPGARRFLGRLDAAALGGALREIVRRHHVLRTRYPARDGRPRQEVTADGGGFLPLVDLRSVPRGRRSAEARRRLASEGRRPFGLAEELPLRAHLFRLDAEEHVLFVNTHHICSDGWSLGIMNRELTALYEALARGEPSPLPEPGVQYADFTVWQHEQLRGEVLESHLAYWRRQLDGLQGLELPTDRPRPAIGTATGASLSLALSEEVSRSLRRRSAEAGASLYMTLLAAFVALLQRVTGQRDVAVGSPIANRRYEEVEGLIGFFVNTLVLRSRPEPTQPFAELLRQVREACLDAYLHQDLPFEKLVEELDPERDLTHSPLFQVMLALQNAPRDDVRMANVQIELFPLAAPRAHFDLYVSFQDAGGRLSAHLSYDAGLFDRTTMQRLARRFTFLLEAASADPVRSLESLAPLPPGERHQLLVEHNDTASAGSWRLLTERFEHHARRRPGEVAVVFAGERMTYGELERRANRWAHCLRDRGVAPESVVGLCVEPSIERVVAMLAILKAGGAYLPLDPGYPRARLAFMMADAGVRLLVTERRLLEALPAEGVEALCLDEERELVADGGEEPPVSGVTPENVAYVIYTSGSTGRPKAILVRHRGASNNLEDLNASFGVGLGDRVLALSSVSFDMSVYEVFGLLGAGGTVVIPEASEARDPAAWVSLLDRHGVTVWNTAPALLEMLVTRLEEGRDARPRLKVAILGGDWVPVTLPDRLKALSAGVRVIVLGGATEASIHSIVYPVEATDRRWRSIPYGRPMRNQEAFLFDARMRAVPLGVAGELYLGGMGLARGYLGRPGLTAEKFVPWALGGRLYRTGDLARRLFDGTIELLGRIDHQVKVRGFRVELGEVGTALKGHPGVEDAVVVARERGLAAYYVPRQGPLSGQELRDDLLARLPEYMVPSSYSPLAALPLSPNGKVDRRSLPEPEPEPPRGFVEPRTSVEIVVAEVWAEVLDRERVGAEDNFFALGGHSLLATQVFSRLHKLLGIELPLRLLFESKTLAGLGERIERFALRSGLDAAKMAQLVLDVERLEEDEVASMLADPALIGGEP